MENFNINKAAANRIIKSRNSGEIIKKSTRGDTFKTQNAFEKRAQKSNMINKRLGGAKPAGFTVNYGTGTDAQTAHQAPRNDPFKAQNKFEGRAKVGAAPNKGDDIKRGA